MHSTVVVFPAPLAPSTPTTSPARTVRSTWSTANRPSYRLQRPCTSTTTSSLIMRSTVPTQRAGHIGLEARNRSQTTGGPVLTPDDAVLVSKDDGTGPVTRAEL